MPLAHRFPELQLNLRVFNYLCFTCAHRGSGFAFDLLLTRLLLILHDTLIFLSNVCEPRDAVMLPKWTPKFEWCLIYMARLVVKNGRQKGTCHNEIGLCACAQTSHFAQDLIDSYTIT